MGLQSFQDNARVEEGGPLSDSACARRGRWWALLPTGCFSAGQPPPPSVTGACLFACMPNLSALTYCRLARRA